MKSIDASKVPLFSKYTKAKASSFRKNIHIPYFIGSPIRLFENNTFSKTNDVLLPIVVLERSPNKVVEYEEIIFHLKSIDLLQTYTKISPKGNLVSFKTSKRYKDLFKEERIDVNINSVREITLKDVRENHDLYKLLPSQLLDKYRNERFLLFTNNAINYIIPMVEVIRFFYCYSESDSLKEAIFHPSGIKLLVKRCTRFSNKYNLYLNNLCEIVDSKKVFYFIHDKTYLDMFHNVYNQYKNHNLLRASFPFKRNFSMFCQTLHSDMNPQNVLITRVLDSDMLNNFFTETGIELHIFHPRSQEKEDKTGIEDPDKNRIKHIPKNIPTEYNDQFGILASLPTQTITNMEDVTYFPEEEKTSIIEKIGKRTEQGGKTRYVPEDIEDFSSSDGIDNTPSQQIKTIQDKTTIIKYPMPEISTKNTEFNQIFSIKKEFTKRGFTTELLLFNFPDRNDGKKLAISYMDKDLLIKRRYLLLLISKSNQKYIYVDVEATKDKNKEILILKNQSKSIAHKCIYHQVEYGNHRWLTRKSLSLLKESDFIRVKHCFSVKNLVKNILNRL